MGATPIAGNQVATFYSGHHPSHAEASAVVNGATVNLSASEAGQSRKSPLFIEVKAAEGKTAPAPSIVAVHVYEAGAPHHHPLVSLSAHNLHAPVKVTSDKGDATFAVDFKNVKFAFNPSKRYVFVAELKFGDKEVTIKSAPISGQEENVKAALPIDRVAPSGLQAPMPAIVSTAGLKLPYEISGAAAPGIPFDRPNSHVQVLASFFGLKGKPQADGAMGGEMGWDYKNGSVLTRFGAIEKISFTKPDRTIPAEVADTTYQLGFFPVTKVGTDAAGNPSYTFGACSITMDKEFEAVTALTIRGETLPAAAAASIVEYQLGAYLGQAKGDDGLVRYRFANGGLSAAEDGKLTVSSDEMRPTRSIFDTAFRNNLGEFTKAARQGNNIEFGFANNGVSSGSITIDQDHKIVSMTVGHDFVPGAVVEAGAGLGSYSKTSKDATTGNLDYAFDYGDIIVKPDGTIVDD